MKFFTLKNILPVFILILCGCVSVTNAQIDTTIAGRKDANKASPVTGNQFNLDSIPHLITDTFIIRSFEFEGNKITREAIILRELPFKKGDSLTVEEMPTLFNAGKTQIMNLGLFHTANVSVALFDPPYVDLRISVKEKWYLWPFPYFKPVDRNLNQWLFEKGASVSRVDYGLKLLYDNATGNNDKIRLYFITGYTKQLTLGYSRPFIDKRLKWGVNLSLNLGKNHEVMYNTIHDKQQFVKGGDYLRNFFNAKAELTYRKKFYTTHFFGVGYNRLHYGDTVLKLNPLMFRQNNPELRFAELYYRMRYQNLDYIPYPTRGHVGEIFVAKQGFDRNMNVWQLTAKGVGYWQLGKQSYYSIGASGTIKAPFKQPYYSQQLLGYGDMFMRGYEYYVIDGVAGGFVNATVATRLTNFSFNIPRTKWFSPIPIPIKIYSKAFGNIGYVHNPYPGPTNRMPNKFLIGGGVGFDIFTAYDFTIKVEFSFNHLGENGIYLQKKDIF